MANVGELIIEITTEATKLNAGLKIAEDRVRATTGKIIEYTNKIALVTTAMGAAITGAFALMIKASVTYGDQIYEVSQKTGIATETLSKLKYAADQTESSFEAVAMGMKFLNKNIYEAVNGNTKVNDTFRTLGIILKDEVNGQVLKADEVFLKIADKFKDLQDNTAKTALAMQIFGRQGESLIPILNLGSAGIETLSKEAERLGLVLTTENARAIDQFSDGMKSLKAASGGLWLEISQLLMPALEKMVKFATDFIVKLREWTEAHKTLSKFVSEATLSLGALLLVLGPLIFGFNQLFQAVLYFKMILPLLIPLVEGLGAALMFLVTNPVGLMISAVALLAMAWINNWGKIRENTEPIINEIGKFLDGLIVKIVEVSLRLTDLATLGLLKQKPFQGGGGGQTRGSGAGGGFDESSAPETGILDETITKVAQHAQKLKELNEEYLSGKINVQDYYNAVVQLHQDGLDIKQQELDLLQKSIDLEYLATDAEYQKLYVMGEGIRSAQEYYQVKAKLANQDLTDQQTSLNAATNLLQTLQSMHKTIWQGVFDFVNIGIKTFSSGFSTALSSIILGTKTAGEAFKDLGVQMITAIVQFVVEWGVQALIAMTLGALLSSMVIAQADIIAAAWLPGAILASIATLGAADAAGTAGLSGALGTGLVLFKGLKAASIIPMATGGSGVVDKPTLFLAGEAGEERFKFTPVNGNEDNSVEDINITVNANVDSNIDIKNLAEELGVEIRRQLRYSRGYNG